MRNASMLCCTSVLSHLHSITDRGAQHERAPIAGAATPARQPHVKPYAWSREWAYNEVCDTMQGCTSAPAADVYFRQRHGLVTLCDATPKRRKRSHATGGMPHATGGMDGESGAATAGDACLALAVGHWQDDGGLLAVSQASAAQPQVHGHHRLLRCTTAMTEVTRPYMLASCCTTSNNRSLPKTTRVAARHGACRWLQQCDHCL
jgi:hypothetical protein